MGIELPSFSLRFGIGVWMFAIVARGLKTGVGGEKCQ